jgi:hypothetical protein
MDEFRELPVPRSTLNEEGITIYLKVSYKAILLVIIIADLFSVSLNEFIIRYL